MPGRYESACPDESELAALLDRTLPGGDRTAVEAHLDRCATCRQTIAHVAATESQPRQLGRYRLERVIGSGGMGVVWQAWDPALERGLAIKLLRADATDDIGSARLVREARALAKLQHPNVIAIHDVGELDGEVFIATELIDGESMERWQRGRPASDVIAAYGQAARGLAAAHALGFVHRDVKPSNILVARDGRVRVGDFGLAIRDHGASATGAISAEARESRLTNDGAIVGTPAYMAPEQRDGNPVDARADQYSLCLAAAEALLGEQPAPDPTPSQLTASGIVAPWDAIARGLATNPADRHADLGPVIAAFGRARVETRPWLFALAGASLLGVAIGVAVAMGGKEEVAPATQVSACEARHPLASTWNADARREISSKFAETKLPYAGDAAAAVIRAFDGWAGELEAEDRRACEDAATGRQSAELAAKRHACLDRAREQMADLVSSLGTAPDAGKIQRGPASARTLPTPSACNTDAGLADQIVARDPAVAERAAATTKLLTIAANLRRLGKLKDARKMVDNLVVTAREVGFLPVLADAQHELGTIMHAQGDHAAEQTLEDALATAALAHADFRTARIAALLVEVVGVGGDVEAAERQARIARPAMIRAGNDRFLEAVVERGLGRANQAASKYEPAYEHYKHAEQIHAGLGNSDDVDFDQRAEVMALGSLDRLDEATRINDQVLASDVAHLGPKHPKTISDMTASGLLLYRAGRYAEAAASLEKALTVDEEVSGRDSVHAASQRARLAATYQALGRLDEAELLLRDTIRVVGSQSPPDKQELRSARMNLALVIFLRERYAEAATQLSALADSARAAKDDEFLGVVLQNLAEALSRDGKHQAALAAGREALDRDAKVFGTISRRGAEAHGTLGNIDVASGDSAAAIREYQTAIEMFEKSVSKDTTELGDPLTGLGETYLSRRDAAAARPVLERAKAVLAKGDPIDLARARFALARTVDALADHKLAVDEARAARDLYRDAGKRGAAKRVEVETWLAAHP